MAKPQFCCVFVDRNRALLNLLLIFLSIVQFQNKNWTLVWSSPLKTTSSAIRMPFFYKEKIGGVVEGGGGTSPH